MTLYLKTFSCEEISYERRFVFIVKRRENCWCIPVYVRNWAMAGVFRDATYGPHSNSNKPSQASIYLIRLQVSSLCLMFALQASSPPTRPQICSPDLKCALPTSTQPSRLQISSLCLKSALQTSNQLSGIKSALHASYLHSIWVLKYASSWRLEIQPCFLQGIVPLGRLPCFHSTFSLDWVPLTVSNPWVSSWCISCKVNLKNIFFSLFFLPVHILISPTFSGFEGCRTCYVCCKLDINTCLHFLGGKKLNNSWLITDYKNVISM